MNQKVTIRVKHGDPAFYGEKYFELKISVGEGLTGAKCTIANPEIIEKNWRREVVLGEPWSLSLRNEEDGDICLASSEGKIYVHLTTLSGGTRLYFEATPENMESVISALEEIERVG